MATHEASVTVERPVRTVYDQWTQFESFSGFMDGVKRVEQLDDRRLRWVTRIAGVDRDFKKFIESRPSETGAWRGEVGQTATS